MHGEAMRSALGARIGDQRQRTTSRLALVVFLLLPWRGEVRSRAPGRLPTFRPPALCLWCIISGCSGCRCMSPRPTLLDKAEFEPCSELFELIQCFFLVTRAGTAIAAVEHSECSKEHYHGQEHGR